MSARLLIVGAGPERENLIRQVETLEISERVEFRDAIPKYRIPELAAEANCLVVNLLDLPLYKYGISLNKLFDYMASARPIIIASSAVNNPVLDGDAGICGPRQRSSRNRSGDEADAGSHSRTKGNMGSQCRDAGAGENYDYAVLGDRLNQILAKGGTILTVVQCERSRRSEASRNLRVI